MSEKGVLLKCKPSQINIWPRERQVVVNFSSFGGYFWLGFLFELVGSYAKTKGFKTNALASLGIFVNNSCIVMPNEANKQKHFFLKVEQNNCDQCLLIR